MKHSEIQGVFREKNKVYTENPVSCKGLKIYNEKLVNHKGRQYRSWSPYRSKLVAAILKGLTIEIKSDAKVLYLGAATGTTVSHVSDIVKDGIVFSVENSPVAAKKLIKVAEKRQNIIPILENAFHPDRYSTFISTVDIVYQDISQRNQAEIFISNIKRFLKKRGLGVLMVKARNIDVSLKPEKAYELVCSKLKDEGIKIINKIDLKPYEKDHATIIVSL